GLRNDISRPEELTQPDRTSKLSSARRARPQLTKHCSRSKEAAHKVQLSFRASYWHDSHPAEAPLCASSLKVEVQSKLHQPGKASGVHLTKQRVHLVARRVKPRAAVHPEKLSVIKGLVHLPAELQRTLF